MTTPELQQVSETLLLLRTQYETERALNGPGWTPRLLQMWMEVSRLETWIFREKGKLEPGKLAF